MRSIDAMGNCQPLHAWLLLAGVGVAVALLTSCRAGEAEKLVSVASPTATTSPTATVAPTAPPTLTPIPTPQPLPPLEAALAGGEVLALRPLVAPDLVYAVKEGHHVTVFHRDINTGQEEVLLEYNERVEAKHSLNAWQELPPSVALSPTEPMLVYSEEADIVSYRIDDETAKTVLRRGAGTGSGELGRYPWMSDHGAELCCAHGLATPAISWDGASTVASMVQYEGHTQAVFRLDGSTACVVSRPGETPPNSLMPTEWSPTTGELLIPSGGAYAAAGLFVVQPDGSCTYDDVAAGIHDEIASFEAAAWSPDGEWIAASMAPNAFDPSNVSLVLMRRDGSQSRTLVDEGFNLWPRFSADGRHVYFIRSEGWLDVLEPTPQSLLRNDPDSGETVTVAQIPDGWSARPQDWTAEGYLMLLASGGECGYYWGCRARLVLLDVATGGVVYTSESADFTNYLGFLQRK